MNSKLSTRASNQSSNLIFPNSKHSNSHSDIDINNKFFAMSKRSQISIFVIVAIVVVGVVIILMFLSKGGGGIINIIEQRVSPDVLPVYNLVEDCLKMTGEDSLVWIGNTGGYLVPNDNSFNDVAYYFSNGENQMPLKEFMETQISSYIDNFLVFCFKDFSDISNFSVNYSIVKSKTRIENNSVFIDVNVPLDISKGDRKYYLKNFKTEIPVRLGVIYDVNKQVMNEQIKKKDAICFTCLKKISEENNVTINMFDGENNTVLFVIDDQLSNINGKGYSFYFANKYE